MVSRWRSGATGLVDQTLSDVGDWALDGASLVIYSGKRGQVGNTDPLGPGVSGFLTWYACSGIVTGAGSVTGSGSSSGSGSGSDTGSGECSGSTTVG